MKITILGSAAAEAIPNPFCQCSVCSTARRNHGRDQRARSAAIINDDLLMDLGPDIVSAANMLGVYLGGVKTLLVTHRHEDHWLPQNLFWRRSAFAPTLDTHLSIYAPADTVGDLPTTFAEQAKFSWKAVNGGDQWTAGQYRITAIPATHGNGVLQGLLYVIDDGSHRVFYATDTAPLSEDAWDILRPLGPMDFILLDATMGPGDGGEAHHGIPQFIKTQQALIDNGLLLPSKTLLAAHHFSHNGGLSHADLLQVFAPYDVEVAFDGWVVNL